MPELPEVESVRRSLLRSGLAGRTITRAEIGWANTVKYPSAEELAASVAGRTVADISRRAKYLLFPLAAPSTSSGQAASTLVAHLGMTGNLVVQPGEQPAHPMTRHTFALDDGRELRFVDARKFGKLWLADDLGKILPPLGPEPLGGDFTTEWLADVVHQAQRSGQGAAAGTVHSGRRRQHLRRRGPVPLRHPPRPPGGGLVGGRVGAAAAGHHRLHQRRIRRLRPRPRPPLARTTGADGHLEPPPRRQNPLPQLRRRNDFHADSGAWNVVLRGVPGLIHHRAHRGHRDFLAYPLPLFVLR